MHASRIFSSYSFNFTSIIMFRYFTRWSMKLKKLIKKKKEIKVILHNYLNARCRARISFVKIFIKRTFIKILIRSSRLLLKERSSRFSSKKLSSNLELNSIFFSVKIFIFFDYNSVYVEHLNDQGTIIKSRGVICGGIGPIILDKGEI